MPREPWWRRAEGRLSWTLLVVAARWYGSRHLDQSDKVRFGTRHGKVYLALDRATPWPDSYTPVDGWGRYRPDDRPFPGPGGDEEAVVRRWLAEREGKEGK